MSSATLSEPAVRDGVFFTDPGPLPRGRHDLTRNQVQGVQRERLLIAATELLAADGYRAFGPGEVARRAGVSLAAFYGCFENKAECVFGGYDRFIEVLLARLGAVAVEGRTQAEIVRDMLGAYLGSLQSDPVVARAYQVEIDALGAPARERRRDALNLFAAFLEEVTRRTLPSRSLPQTAFIGVVYAARQLASDALDTEADPDLEALGEDLQAWVADLFREV